MIRRKGVFGTRTDAKRKHDALHAQAWEGPCEEARESYRYALEKFRGHDTEED